MKHLMYYKIFEAEEPEIDITKTEEDPKLDAENVEVQEASLKNVQAQVKEYNAKKGQIDNVYKTIKDDYQLKLAVERILGRDVKKRNPFLVQYDQFALIDRNIKKLQQQVIDDTSSITKYNKDIQALNDLLRLEQNPKNQTNLKLSIQKNQEMVKNLKLNINNNNKNIPKLKQSLLGKKTFIDSMKSKILQINNMSNKK